MARCKYYIGGVCYSPATIKTFSEPSREPVNTEYCLTERFKECRYFIDAGTTSSDELYKAMGIEFSKDFYSAIHAIPCDMASSCPFYRLTPINEERNLCVAYCSIFEKYLTKSSIKKCIEDWNHCPFYKIGVEVTA